MLDQMEILALSPAERTAYQALLDNGPLTPPNLAKQTGLSRVNAYAALKGLAIKGLASDKDINKKQIYSLEPPTKLRDLAMQKLESVRSQATAVEALIPNLMNLYSISSNKPGIITYEGLDGIKKAYEDTLKAPRPEEILVLRSRYDYKILDEFILDYIGRRAKLGVKSRLIGHYFPGHLNDRDLLRERRFYPAKSFTLPTEVSIYSDKVALISLRKDLIATVIQSKDVAQTFRMLFELLWQQAAPNLV